MLEPNCTRIPLGPDSGITGAYALVDPQDYARLAKHRWHILNGYAFRPTTENGRQRTLYMHRELMGLAYGDTRQVDHINHNRCDNRRSNLRIVTVHQNAQNLTHLRRSKTGVRGVYWRPELKKYCALVQVNGQKHYLGVFTTFEAADHAAQAGRARLMTHAAESGG